eukprot:gene8-11_t
MELSPMLLQTLKKLGFEQPTAIQAKSIPLALQQKDILGSAQTGTGKTLAFVLPLVNKLLNQPGGVGMILTPTRELAQQIHASIHQIVKQGVFIKTALLIGGDSIDRQLTQLRAKPSIIIGTPGRVIDHLKRRSFNPSLINFLVLDETDRMFDMGFSIQLEHIIKELPTQRQTLMFSATFPPQIEQLATKYMLTPERVFINNMDSANIVAQNLTQEVINIKDGDKYMALTEQLQKCHGTTIIFVKTKDNADHLSLRLNKEAYNTCAIHGNLRQAKRERVMRAFRQGRHEIMVATDIAARGLDVPHIKHVINYDIPHAPEDYVHRIGRTARAGATGLAVSFVSPQDRKRWDAIQDLLNPQPKKQKTSAQETIDPVSQEEMSGLRRKEATLNPEATAGLTKKGMILNPEATAGLTKKETTLNLEATAGLTKKGMTLNPEATAGLTKKETTLNPEAIANSIKKEATLNPEAIADLTRKEVTLMQGPEMTKNVLKGIHQSVQLRHA